VFKSEQKTQKSAKENTVENGIEQPEAAVTKESNTTTTGERKRSRGWIQKT